MRPLASVGLLLGVALLAGCAAPALEPAADVSSNVVAAWRHTYACGAGGEDACAPPLGAVGKSLQEPVLALHPTSPRVLALGVNEGQHVGAAQLTVPAVVVSPVRVAVHVSADGGETWTDAGVPLPAGPLPARATVSGDPSLAFDREGRLHVTGMDGRDIFHVVSADVGASWSEPIRLSEGGGADRNWITALPDGSVLVVWQRPSIATEAAISKDGGASWQALAPIEGCVTPSAPLVVEGRVLLVCTIFSGERDLGVQLHALDVAAGTWSLASETRELTVRFPMLARQGDLLVAAGREAELRTVLWSASADGGSTWTAASDAREFGDRFAGWDDVSLYALIGDEGGAHFVLTGAVDGPGGLVATPTGRAHVVVDARSGALALEDALGGVPAIVPQNGAPPIAWSDDFGAAVSIGEETLLAYGLDGMIHFARVHLSPG